jgi:uncharacterized membrane protein
MFFAKLHPLIVHFPVGLLVSGALFEIYGKVGKEEAVRVAGRFNVRLGFWCALPVMVVGFLGMLGLEDTKKFESYLGNHILSVFATLVFFLTALLISRYCKGWFWGGYYVFLGLGLMSILATGYFGGEMVHRFGVSTLNGVP